MALALALALIIVLLLVVERGLTQAAHGRQIAELVQRIQAPEQAVAAQARREDDRPRRRSARVIPLDDDKAMNDALEGKSDATA